MLTIHSCSGGHKANLNNPNTSDESKEHSRQVLKDMESEDGDTSRTYNERTSERTSVGDAGEVDESGKDMNRVLGGYKATLHSEYIFSLVACIELTRYVADDRTSDEAKQHAREVLEEHGVTEK